MGVPKFYRWISERYPCLSEIVKEHQIPEFDNLYLDMNGIIHVCSHPNDNDPHFRITDEKIFADICFYIDFLFKIIKPKKVFFMAVDGVAPRAKMNQQRGRRFRTAKEAVTLEQKAKEHGEILPTEARFDSNCITPGTIFMCRLQEILKDFVAYKISTDVLWQNIRVYLSGHETPGEGEHKIMDFIRFEKADGNYNPNTRHCLYGLDADLIMLGLCSHEPHFSLLREEVKFGKSSSQKRTTTAQETTFHLLHLSLLREYLALEFKPMIGAMKFEYDVEKVIDDFVLMSFLVGNDFIPHLPELHIHNDALPILFRTYAKALPALGGYINEAGHLNLERFEMFFDKLAQFDYDKFGENCVFPPPGSRNDEEPDFGNEKLADKLVNLGFSELSCSKTTEYDTSDEEEDDGANFELEFRQHKENYYRDKLEYPDITPEVLKEQAETYVTAIQWNLYYYYDGVASWSWFYPHHYAPYISDVKNFKNMEIVFDMGEPFAPFQQLIAVLPPLSKELLPLPYQELMTDTNSPLKSFYPVDFETDRNGKQQDWEALVLIPFINEDLLLSAAKIADRKLSPDEKKRNKHGPHLMFTYLRHSSRNSISFLPKYFPALGSNHSKCLLLDKHHFRLPSEQLSKGLCKGVLMDVLFPGFPTLKHLEHTAQLRNEDVKVFQMISQRDNLMLTLTKDRSDEDIEKVANQLLGQTVYVSWPHLQEALVVAVADDDCYYEYKNNKCEKSHRPNNERIWDSEAESVLNHYYRRLGVFIGDVSILVYVRVFNGSKLVPSPTGDVIEEKQYSNTITSHALQTTVKDIAVHNQQLQTLKKVEDLFPLNATVFMLGHPYFGCMGTVAISDPSKHKGKLFVKFEVVKDVDLTSVIRNEKKLSSQPYMPGYILAQKLGISSHFLSRITGTFFVQTSSKESISPTKINVGLNLKFNRTNEEVAGFSRKTDGNQWVYSNQVLEILNAYFETFSDFCEKLVAFVENDVVFLEELYPNGNGREILSKVVEWLKNQQCSSAEKQTCGMSLLDENIISAIEKVASSTPKEIQFKTISVDPKLLFNPLLCKGSVSPQPDAVYNLFDRVVNVGHTIAVPLGLRGTVIGIRTAEQTSNNMYEVLFDEEFFGGIPLRSTSNKGYRMSPSNLINISTEGEDARAVSSSTRNILSRNEQVLNSSQRRNSAEHHQKHSPQRIKILKNSSQPNKPFYKNDGILSPDRNKDTDSPNPFNDTSGQNMFNSPNKQFVMPKASPRRTPVPPKTNNNSDFAGMWKNLVQSTSTETQTSPTKGPCPAVQELFEAAKKHENERQTASSTIPPPHPKHKPVAVLELMSLCMKSYGRLPTYIQNKISMTNSYIASVTMPYGNVFSSSQFPTQEEATENAAELALVDLKKRLHIKPQPMRMDSVPMQYVTRNPYKFFPPQFQQQTHTYIRPPMSFPSPPVLPYAPPNQFMNVIRFGNNPDMGIESFVGQNPFHLAGQNVSTSQMQALQNLARTDPNSSKTSANSNDHKNPAEEIFVPLQVLMKRTKEENQETAANLLKESEWPPLSTKVPTAIVNDDSLPKTVPTLVRKKETDLNGATESSLTNTASVSKPHRKPPRIRLAAAFTNMPSPN